MILPDLPAPAEASILTMGLGKASRRRGDRFTLFAIMR
jgi:hypothetical protein